MTCATSFLNTYFQPFCTIPARALFSWCGMPYCLANSQSFLGRNYMACWVHYISRRRCRLPLNHLQSHTYNLHCQRQWRHPSKLAATTWNCLICCLVESEFASRDYDHIWPNGVLMRWPLLRPILWPTQYFPILWPHPIFPNLVAPLNLVTVSPSVMAFGRFS